VQKTFAPDLTVLQSEQLWHGVRLLELDMPFEAHECFEEVFRQTHGATRTLFRAMTQVSAAYHQLRLGRARAARSTLKKACRNLELVDLLSDTFQLRVEALLRACGADEGCPRFIEVPVHGLTSWPVPDGLPPTTQGLVGSGVLALPVVEARATARERIEGSMSSEQKSGPGFNEAVGIKLLETSGSKVVGELLVTSHHHQPWGIVHGGVYCSVVETVCSIGAQLALGDSGGFIVGVDNHTSFLKATRSGTLRVVAQPLSRGRRTQLWEANIQNEQGELVATGRVRLMVIEAGKSLAGETAALKSQ
jgi:uncharacterized protein (TIGR00369 family)